MNSSDHGKPARRFRSATIYDGLIRSTTRSFLYGLGQDDDDIARPHLAVIHTGGEMSPCNTSLAGQAQHAKTGIYAAGGMPHECPVVSVSDGLSIAHSGMRFSLISRELIADSVEAIVRGPQFDGIFALGGCDKNLPGLMMGMVRCKRGAAGEFDRVFRFKLVELFEERLPDVCNGHLTPDFDFHVNTLK